MDNEIRRPNAALINREWFEAARTVCQPELLGRILYAATEYVLYGKISIDISGQAGIVLAMIKPALDSDIAKYAERCERNQRNAIAGRQRVAASGSESQRVAANTTTTTTSTPTSTSTTTPSLSPIDEIERERWIVFGYFWSTGSKAIKQEFEAFWSYYESLGWRNNKGAAIVSKLAAARMWKRQFETGVVPDGAEGWFRAVQPCKIPDFNIWQAFAGAERQDDHVLIRLRCSASYLEKLVAAVPTLERDLRTIWRCQTVKFETAG